MPASPSVDSTDRLESALGYRFNDRSLLFEALTHRTFVHENPQEADGFNERQEFLGDSVLGLVVSEYLFHAYPDEDEGVLSRRKAALVQESTLARWALEVGVDGCLRLGRGEEQSGGRAKPSLLADALEASLAAVFLDGGWAGARGVVRRWIPWLEGATTSIDGVRDYKTELQELAQRNGGTTPVYHVTEESGPEHRKIFTVAVSVEDRVLGTGRGSNKKEAAQAAARDALESVKTDEAS